MEIIPVNLSSHPYSIHLSADEREWGPLIQSLIPFKKVIILTNPKVARFCQPVLKRVLSSIRVVHQTLLLPDGERFKNLATVAKAYKGFLKLRADRSTPVLLLGGGVLGDLGGFATATYLRGLPFIQVPTTLVAQVDSSIGGKLGIDLPEGKNLVGVFQQPQAVISHIPFLKTLSKREILGGLGEVLKYGVIEDSELFRFVMREKENIVAGDTEMLFKIVLRSSKIKAQVVAEDEKETRGRRLILNFGHTFGHALERLTKYRKFHHGEAIAVGMNLAACISQKLGFCTRETAMEVEDGVRKMDLPLLPPSFAKQEWIRALEVDKKSREGMIQFVFLKRIGEVVVEAISPRALVKLL